MSTSSTAANTELLGLHPTEAAFHKHLPQIEATPDEGQPHINVEMVEVVATTMAKLPQIRALRPEIVKRFNGFNLQQFDDLEGYTLALNHAHVRYRNATGRKQDLSELTADLEEVRDNLTEFSSRFAKLNLIDISGLKDKLRKTPGYIGLAGDVLALVQLLKDNSANLEGKSPFSRDILNAYATRALDLQAAVGSKDQAVASAAEATRARRKAFHLFRTAYEQAQRAAFFIGGQELMDEVTPSFYAGRGGRRPLKAETPEAADEAPSDPSNPANESGEHLAPVPAAPARATTAATTAAAMTAGRAAAAAALTEENFVVSNPTGLPITHPLKS